MINFKSLKSILLTTVLTLGLSLFISNNAFATTYTTVSCDSLYKLSQLFSTTTANLIVVPTTNTITYSASDVDLLSRLITAEAQGEPYEAKVAVGAVVVNRVKNNTFPNSVNEVIYQKINGYYQFTPVLNGWINKPADFDSIKAAKAALNGVDPTNGALFYFDNSITNIWLLAKEVSITIDKLTFAY